MVDSTDIALKILDSDAQEHGNALYLVEILGFGCQNAISLLYYGAYVE